MNKYQIKVDKMIDELNLILQDIECNITTFNCLECENNKICKRIAKARIQLLKLRNVLGEKP